MRTDAIRLTQKQQALLRRQAIELRETGTSNKEVAQILGVHQKTVSGWWPAYRRIGSALFEPGKQGRRRGDKRKLTAPREREVPNRGVVRFLVYTGELDAAILV